MKLLKALLKLIVFLVILFVVYLVLLAFTVVPVEYTPQEMTQTSYKDFKRQLSISVAKNDAMSGISKTTLDFLKDVEKDYAIKVKKDKESAVRAEEEKKKEPGAVTKARETVDQYQQKIDDQQKVLDNL